MPNHVTEIDLRDRVAAQSQSVGDYMELASLLYRTQRFEEAVATLRHGLAGPLQPIDRAALLVTLGWYLTTMTHEVTEPRILAEQAITLIEGIETTEALFVRAKARSLMASCASRGDLDAAMKLASSALCILDEVLKRTASTDAIPAHEALLEAARLNCLLGRFEEAAERCAQAIRTAPDKEQELNCLIELGTILRDSGHLFEARETLNKAIGGFDAPPWALVRPYYELGLTERALGKLAEARAKIRKVIDILQSDPKLPRGYMSEGLRVTASISYGIGDFESAETSFREAVDSYPTTDPLHWNCLLWLARCQCDLGQFDIARTNAQSVEKSQVASESDREDAGWLLREIGPA